MPVRFACFAAAVGIFVPALAGAYQCPRVSPAERLARADVVFAGIVISAVRPPSTLPFRSTDEIITHVFQVTHVWKGSVGDSIVVGISSSLSVADHYLIYAWKGRDRLLGDVCGGHPLIADAAYDLYTLPPPARSLGVRDLPEITILSLVNDLDDPSGITRTRAASALGDIGEMPERVVPALAQILTRGDKRDRIEAAIALGKFGPKAEEAVPVLVHSSQTGEPGVRQAAHKALGQIGQPVPAVVAALERGLRDQDKWIRFYSAIALGEIGPAAEEAADALIETVGDEDKDVRRQGIRALGKLGPAAADAVPVLATILDDESLDVAQLAAWSLGQIGRKSAVLIPGLIRDLQHIELDEDFDDLTWQARLVAVSALGSIARDPETVVPAPDQCPLRPQLKCESTCRLGTRPLRAGSGIGRAPARAWTRP